MMEYIPFCEQWSAESWEKRDETAQEKYVAAELRRLVDENQPVLRAILTCPDEWPQHLAMRLLTTGATTEGEIVVEMPQVFLRLVAPERLEFEHPDTGEVQKGVAVPPPRDPQGRPLPKQQVGKVLVAKVGNLGGNLSPDREASIARAFGGDKRLSNAKAGRPLYITREVTRDAKPFSLREAVIILRQWGFGIGESAFRSLRSADSDGKRERGQCLWLVEEVGHTEAAEDMIRARKAAQVAPKPAAPKE